MEKKFGCWTVWLVVCLLVDWSSAIVGTGTIEVDAYSMRKLVPSVDHHVLVLFVENSWDEPVSWGDVAQAFKEREQVLLLKAPTSDATLKERYASTLSPPFVQLFPKGSSSPVDFTGKVDQASEVIAFVNTQLSPELKELVKLANGFLTNPKKDAAIKAAQSLADRLTDEDLKRYATMFVKNMEKIKEKGEEFVQSEIARLDSLANNPNTVTKKQQEFRLRSSVLNAFAKELSA